MSNFTIVIPEYSRRFLCLGRRCEDDCCHGWTVPIDESSLAKYRSLAPGSLRSDLDGCVVVAQSGDGATAATFRTLASGVCPFLTHERLCRIQLEMGPSWLSETCAGYPRRTHCIDGLAQVTLTLSCPEAARLVLLDPELQTSPVRRHSLPWNTSLECSHPIRTFYWPVREFLSGLIRERSYALWQRLFLVGVFCQRLDAIHRGEDKRTFPQFIRDFSAVLASGSLRAPMQTIPANPGLQLRLVLELIRLGSGAAPESASLSACLSTFNAGIGSGYGTTPEAGIPAYSDAYVTTFEPFFRERPWILENYLTNEILHAAFPFGEAFFRTEMALDCTASFMQLAVHFGILKGLLIGIAAARGSAFSTGDVIQAVTVVSRQFEHSRRFLEQSCAFLEENRLSNLAGLTALLRN